MENQLHVIAHIKKVFGENFLCESNTGFNIKLLSGDASHMNKDITADTSVPASFISLF